MGSKYISRANAGLPIRTTVAEGNPAMVPVLRHLAENDRLGQECSDKLDNIIEETERNKALIRRTSKEFVDWDTVEREVHDRIVGDMRASLEVAA